VDGVDVDASGLADEQAALRRVAEIVAGGASQSTVFGAVTDEACALLGGHFTALLRYEPDGPAVIMAMRGADRVDHVMAVGMRLSGEGDGVVQRVRRSSGAVRIDNYDGVPGPDAATARALGLTSGVGAPIVAEGRVWGVMTVLGSGASLPASAEGRLGMFARLVATAISDAQARANLAALADEQTALRRVAELMARGVTQDELFDTVAVEASKLVHDEATVLLRFDDDRHYTVVAACGGPAPVGAQIEVALDDEGVVAAIRRTGRPARLDDDSFRSGAAHARDHYGLGLSVGVPVVVDDHIWGILGATTRERRLATDAERRLGQFGELVAAALANAQARDVVDKLIHEQIALRAVAELVARGGAPRDVFAAVAAQASKLLDDQPMTLVRFDGEDELVVVATRGGPAPIGERIVFEPDTLPDWVRRSAVVARVDDYSGQHDAQLALRFDLRAAVAAPIVVDGDVWGMLTATSDVGPLRASTEASLRQFAELVAATIANTQARIQVRKLADEQAALRRVAELVARVAPLGEVFAAIATEAARLLDDQAAALLRYDADGFGTVVAAHNSPAQPGLRLPSDGDTGTGQVRRTGRPFSVDSFEGTSLAELARTLGVRAATSVPILVEGNVWGALSTSTVGPPPSADAEERLAQFAELAAAAIASAENKAKLNASLARVVAAADETRHRLQRDVHDTAQQRLVHTIIALKLARDAIAAGNPPDDLVHEALIHAERANAELRDVVRGILPASLTRGGLRSGLESLAEDLTLPVDVRVRAPRLPAPTEITVYFIVAEALANVVKHAHATHATVDVALDGDVITIAVRDDGRGGADPAKGTGLTGMSDRVDANEGTLTITSPPGRGTIVHAVLTVVSPDVAT
jgi:signal transduction histidine kinase